MRTSLLLFLALLETAATSGPAQLAPTSEDALRPWAADTERGDAPRSHVEEITSSQHSYTVAQGGTMDGANCRSPMGCGIAREGAMLQKWESNRSVRMENVGTTDVINPWLSNGRNTFRTVAEIVATATTPDMSDADKAFALWFQEIEYRHHDGGDNNELLDPVKVFNCYGYNTCGNDSIALATLWRAAGLRAAPARLLGHCISQAFYDNGWHLFDGDMHSVYLSRDNQSVCGELELVRDHDLVKRTHSKGILMPDTWWDGQGMCAMYSDQEPVWGERGGAPGATMNMTLRPGEAIVWRWGQTDPVKHHGALGTMPVYPSLIYDGLWEYHPDFSNNIWRKGASSIENIESGAGVLTAETGKTATVIWTMRSPYVFVGGKVISEGTDVKFFVSVDGKTWQKTTGDLDQYFPTVGAAHYEYQIKCQLEGSARLRRLAVINDIQMAPLALPEMIVGENKFFYSDQSGAEHAVRITHRWVERSTSAPPSPPAQPIYPGDSGEANGTDISFQWAANQPNAEPVGDYLFELSARPDMRFPLSMDFYKLISRTADVALEKTTEGGERKIVKPRYTLAQPGLLTPDRSYYWRVRAMSEKGVWGGWSKTWSFTPRGPAYPMDVTLAFDAARGAGTLHWKPNPLGRRPVKYRIYGSDEMGFTAADANFQGTVGVSKEQMASWNPWFPANFIAETTSTELPVLGQDVNYPSANRTYYRVVAVDEQGKRSGPSDYATAPRPVLYSKPVLSAKVGAGYRYQLCANRSLGDLSMRMDAGNTVSGYFDLEKPAFAIEHGPAWLKVDQETGLLSGVPDSPGKFDVAVTATINRDVRKLDEKVLVWGNEKVLSSATERVGAATQDFVIDVQ